MKCLSRALIQSKYEGRSSNTHDRIGHYGSGHAGELCTCKGQRHTKENVEDAGDVLRIVQRLSWRMPPFLFSIPF